MRTLPLLAALVLVLPLASAQTTEVEVSVDPLEGPVRPLQAAMETRYRVEVTCLPASPTDAAPRAVHVWVSDAPAWVSVAAKPAETAVDASGCGAAPLVVEGILEVRVDDKAPAGKPAKVTLSAAAEGFGANETGAVAFDVESAFFSILDVQLVETIAVAPPGGTHTYPVGVSNFGNDATRVRLELVEKTEGLEVALPEPVTLESRQQGGAAITAELAVQVTGPEGFGYLNEVGVVTLRVVGERVGTDERAEGTTVSFIHTTKGFDTPPAPLPLWLPLVVAAALALARKR